ncbi:hypothetical protein FRC12_021745, partial [Ceratobasidium sp. 428]
PNHKKHKEGASNVTNQVIGVMRAQMTTPIQADAVEMKPVEATGAPRETVSSVVNQDTGAMHVQTETQEWVLGEDEDKGGGAAEVEGALQNLAIAGDVGEEGLSLPLELQMIIDSGLILCLFIFSPIV